MAILALADGFSQVQCSDGAVGSYCGGGSNHWDLPFLSQSGSGATGGSTSVKVNGKPVVLEGKKMAPHPDGQPCTPTPINHEPTLSPPAGGTVYIEGKLVGRVGDMYNVGTSFNHVITTGSSNVIVG